MKRGRWEDEEGEDEGAPPKGDVPKAAQRAGRGRLEDGHEEEEEQRGGEEEEKEGKERGQREGRVSVRGPPVVEEEEEGERETKEGMLRRPSWRDLEEEDLGSGSEGERGTSGRREEREERGEGEEEGGASRLRSRWLDDEEEEEEIGKGREKGKGKVSQGGSSIPASGRGAPNATAPAVDSAKEGLMKDGAGEGRERGEDEGREKGGEEREGDSDGEEGSEAENSEPLNPAYQSLLRGCRSVDEFERMDVLGEGVYGVVHRAKDKATGEIYALKRVKLEKEREGFPLTSLREINILLSMQHPAIVGVKEVVVNKSMDRVFMVMEYVEHEMKVLLETMKQPFALSEVKSMVKQLLEGLEYMHHNWVLHRDIKTSNILMNNKGQVKFCDFGLARQYGQPLRVYTQPVVTLWYRPPELLLGQKEYSTAVDVWSMGCVMAEFLLKTPLFKGESDLEQLNRIFADLGMPTAEIWPEFPDLPGCKKVKFTGPPTGKLRERFPVLSIGGRPALSDAGFDLLTKMLAYDPSKRISAQEALQHPWFSEQPLPKSLEHMPRFPVVSESERKRCRSMRSPDPLKELQREERKRAKAGGQTGLFSQ